MTDAQDPGLRALTEEARRIWQASDDLPLRFGHIESLAFWAWLLTSGFDEHPKLRQLLPDPPPELTGRVAGTTDAQRFRRSAVSDAFNLYQGLMAAGFDPSRPGERARLLDFGCGCGRLLRVFARFAEHLELQGADVDSEAVAWCTANMGYARFAVLEEQPPTAWPDGWFSAVISYSVFSHLPEPRSNAWIQELHRITRPGAALVLTVQGWSCFDQYSSGERADSDVIDRSRLEAERPVLEEHGFLYHPYASGRPWRPDGDRSEEYGLAFLLESYIQQHWAPAFDIVEFRPSPQGWQDYVILRRR